VKEKKEIPETETPGWEVSGVVSFVICEVSVQFFALKNRIGGDKKKAGTAKEKKKKKSEGERCACPIFLFFLETFVFL